MALLLAATILVIHRSPPIRRADRKVIGFGFDLIAIAMGATQAPIAVPTISLKGLKWRPRECSRLRAPPTSAGKLPLVRQNHSMCGRVGYTGRSPTFLSARVPGRAPGHLGLRPLAHWLLAFIADRRG